MWLTRSLFCVPQRIVSSDVVEVAAAVEGVHCGDVKREAREMRMTARLYGLALRERRFTNDISSYGL